MISFKWSSGLNSYRVSIPFGFILSGWLFMLLMGILHLNVLAIIPPIGYGLSVLIMFLVQMISWLHNSFGD